ncbi:hypothetical protein SAMN04488554_1508 [Ruania alba]|uniref:DUF2332 domain-containing protein n=2 Tax=Ruania alba TaxID=648782 RepID=A0A1H5G132_9MICO|nr:hypothetical protein SAMN04488554_1508 [Ruania alba]
MSARVATALSESDDALDALAGMPARKRNPAMILAALHDLALAGRAPRLAAAHASLDGPAAARVAVEVLVRMSDEIVAGTVHRRVHANETGRCAVLYPAIAEAARRAGAEAVGLIDVGCGAALNLTVDRVGLTYSNGQRLGDDASIVQMEASIVGERRLPARALPHVTTRIGIDTDPIYVTDPVDARWLRACISPEHPDRIAQLETEMTLLATEPPDLLHGDTLDVLPDALARVPASALPVITTTWSLAKLLLESRWRFLRGLDEIAAHRPMVWVSVEGVGVAPTVPTFGDRHASGHSIIGVSILDGASRQTEAVGRCWSRGRLLSWLAEA